MGPLFAPVAEAQLENLARRERLSHPHIADALVRADFSPGVRAEQDGGKVVAVGVTITSETRDSYGDIIRTGGRDLTRFLRNPVVLWAHEQRGPTPTIVGNVTAFRVGSTPSGLPALLADVTFAGSTALAREVAQLWLDGFLHATSIGFKPVEVGLLDKDGNPVADDDDDDFGWWLPPGWGFDYKKWELLELSFCAVPANPDAVREVRRALQSAPAVARSLGWKPRRTVLVPRTAPPRAEHDPVHCAGCPGGECGGHCSGCDATVAATAAGAAARAAELIERAGKVLSAASLAKVQAASTAIGSATAALTSADVALKDLISSAAGDPPEPPAPAEEPQPQQALVEDALDGVDPSVISAIGEAAARLTGGTHVGRQ